MTPKEFWPAIDCKGREVHPGDRVSAARYPRGRLRGVVFQSKDSEIRRGEVRAALKLRADDGSIYSLPEGRHLRLLKNQKPTL